MGERFYRVGRAIVKPIFWLLFGVRLRGGENLRYTGRMLLIANHTSNIDPFFLGCADRHVVHFMAKKELFQTKIGAAFFRSIGTFPVDRGKGDVAAVQAAGRVLQQDETLAIFPEGKRNKRKGRDWSLLEFQNGATLIALRNESPVLPICFADRPRMFHRTRIVVGEPIDLREWMDPALSRAENIRQISKRLRETILQMKREAEAASR